MTYRVAIVGTGNDPGERDREGYAMAYRHAGGYERLDSCSLVACADIVRENAEAFADHHDLEAVYEDHETMLEGSEPDVVSVCVPPSVHAELRRSMRSTVRNRWRRRGGIAGGWSKCAKTKTSS